MSVLFMTLLSVCLLIITAVRNIVSRRSLGVAGWRLMGILAVLFTLVGGDVLLLLGCLLILGFR